MSKNGHNAPKNSEFLQKDCLCLLMNIDMYRGKHFSSIRQTVWPVERTYIQGFFFIDTNAIWSCGRTVHFFDMRSFANCSLWKGILFDIWHMAIYSIRPCRKSDTKKGGKSGFKETSFSRTKICWWLFWWFLSKHAIFLELFICK